MKKKVFTNEQVLSIVTQDKQGIALSAIASNYDVSRPTIQKLVKENCPEYSCKKRKSELFATDLTTKRCPICGRELPLSCFNKGNCKYGKSNRCKECERDIQNDPVRRLRRQELRRERRKNAEYRKHSCEIDALTRHSNPISLKKSLLRSAKQRAKAKGLDFNITIDDFELPTICPLLDITLSSEYKQASDNSYSLDRIDSSKGYIKGNVWVISNKANRMKSNATLQELELLVKNLRKRIH